MSKIAKKRNNLNIKKGGASSSYPSINKKLTIEGLKSGMITTLKENKNARNLKLRKLILEKQRRILKEQCQPILEEQQEDFQKQLTLLEKKHENELYLLKEQHKTKLDKMSNNKIFKTKRFNILNNLNSLYPN